MLNAIRVLAVPSLICLTVSVRVAEPSWRDFKDVANISYAEPGGERSIQLSIDVPASPHGAFTAIATNNGLSKAKIESAAAVQAVRQPD